MGFMSAKTHPSKKFSLLLISPSVMRVVSSGPFRIAGKHYSRKSPPIAEQQLRYYIAPNKKDEHDDESKHESQGTF